jgi:hypothetical protein
MYIHTFTVVVESKPINAPQNIGIDSSLWKDHYLDNHGIQGMTPLHTHDDNSH